MGNIPTLPPSRFDLADHLQHCVLPVPLSRSGATAKALTNVAPPILVKKVVVYPERIEVSLHPSGIANLVIEVAHKNLELQEA